MKNLLFILSILLSCNFIGLCQESHLSLIYDFEANDFENSVIGMVGTNDSLYVACQTADGRGKFFKIDKNGQGYKTIWNFDILNYAPNSLVGNDTVIFGTTRFSKEASGALFRYSLKDFSFKFIKKFDASEVTDTRIEYITDSVLWLTSQGSTTDNGSIFTIKEDGTDLKKPFNDFDNEKGTNPTDFVFHNDSIYIACYGGGLTYSVGEHGNVYCGNFIRVKSDGTGCQIIVKGSQEIGTQPQSIIIRDNKLYGLFAHTGSRWSVGAQLFKSNLNGTSYESIGTLSCRSVTKMLSTDSLIYGTSCSQIFGFNPYTGEKRIFEDIQSNPDFGFDMVSNPVQLNDEVFIAAQQGGPNNGGTILKWTNRAPEIKSNLKKGSQYPTEIVLKDLFTDPERDSLTFTYDFDENKVAITESKGMLTIIPLQPDETEVKITASDGWLGYRTYSLKVNSLTNIDLNENDDLLKVYPNPTHSILNIGSETVESVEIFTLSGKLIKSYINPGNSIDISAIENGAYLIRVKESGHYYFQKIIKN